MGNNNNQILPLLTEADREELEGVVQVLAFAGNMNSRKKRELYAISKFF